MYCCKYAPANTELCRDGRVDTVFGTGDGSYYVFKGSKYWKLDWNNVTEGYPRNIASDWRGLPDNIDAAFTQTDTKKTYFFKGDKYWKFEDREPHSGYPKNISDDWSGIPNNVDSAFVWSGDGKIYFFKGSSYWKFDEEREWYWKFDEEREWVISSNASSSNPEPISNWPPGRPSGRPSGLPDGLSAAVKYYGYTYFFHEDEYYRFDDDAFSVAEGYPSFPRKNGRWWFGCGNDSGT